VRSQALLSLLVAGLLASAACLAQAPAEDRRLPGDALGASQQRISALLRERDEADARLKVAEVEARNAVSTLEEARKRNEAAGRALKQAQQRSTQAGRAYAEESAAFERLRNPAAPAKSAVRTADKRQ
jgi:hypothetical protein